MHFIYTHAKYVVFWSKAKEISLEMPISNALSNLCLYFSMTLFFKQLYHSVCIHGLVYIVYTLGAFNTIALTYKKSICIHVYAI